MNKKDKSAIVKWTILISFVILVIGGLNYLIKGLFEFDLFGEIFGTYSVVGRIVYVMFGLAAVILASIIIWRAYYQKENSASKSTAK